MTNQTSEDELREQIKSINRLGDYKYTPSNVVLVTVEDIIELVHNIAPYTMSRLDEASADRKKHELQARIDTIRRCLMMLVNKPDTALDLMQEWHDSLIKETAK